MVFCVLQVPVLFSGTLRANLDPFALHTEAQVWLALELCHLKERVRLLPAQLLHPVQRTSLAFRCVGKQSLDPSGQFYMFIYQNIVHLHIVK